MLFAMHERLCFHSWSPTFRHGCLGTANLLPGLLGAETFSARGKKNFFQKESIFSQKIFFVSTNSFFFLK